MPILQCISPEDLSAPILRDFYRLWNSRRGNRHCPARTDMAPIDMRFTFPSTAVIEVEGRPPRFRFRYANINWTNGGTPHGLAGQNPERITMPGFAQHILPIWREVVATGVPVGVIRNDISADILPSREALVLPFAFNHVEIDRLMMILDPQGHMIDPLDDLKSMPRFVQPNNSIDITNIDLRRIFGWWLAARQDDGLAPINFVDDPQLRPYADILVHIDFDPRSFAFRYLKVGTHITRIVGAELDGFRFDEVLPLPVLVEVTAVLDHAVESRRPIFARGHRNFGLSEQGFDILILPLGQNGQVTGFLNCQIYDPD